MTVFSTPFGTALLLSGAVFITLISLNLLKEVIAPLLLAMMIAIITMPLVEHLQKKGVPRFIALIGVALILFLGALGLVLFLYIEIQQLLGRVPGYQILLAERFAALESALQHRGLDPNALIQNAFPPDRLSRVTLNILGAILSQSASLLFFLLLLLTLTLDYQGVAQGFSSRFNPKSPLIQGIIHFIREIQVNFHLMTIANLISAVAITGVFYLFKIDFALLWGVLTFFLSYIPRFGMIMSFIPPSILTFILYGPQSALYLLLLAFAFNGLTDNFITPRLTGIGLGLRSTTVIVSAIIWIWVLGPIGALIAVPMTLLVRALLASHPATEAVAYAISTDEYPQEKSEE